MDPTSRKKLRQAILVTVFLTGFAGLVYEVTWQRYLANLLGSQAKSTSIVLAVFLGGLALGYQLFGGIAKKQKTRNLVKLCGFAEIGIGLWAFLFPLLYGAIWKKIGVLNPMAGYATLIEISLAVFLLGIPTVLMGCTLPLLTQGLSREDQETPGLHARIYAWNTGGAFLGCLMAGFVLLPWLGLPITSMNVGVINILCGLFLAASGQAMAEADDQEDSVQPQPPFQENPLNLNRKQKAVPILIALLAGFSGICLQTVLVRVAALSLGSSEFTFSMIVALYILMLALGAGMLGRAAVSPRRSIVVNQVQLSLGLLIAYLLVPFLPYGALLVRTLFSSVLPAFYLYHCACFVALGLVLAIPVLAAGKSMPLLFAVSNPSVSSSGGDVGRLYFWNAAGCVLGALLGGYFLLFWLNMDGVLKLAMLCSLASLALMLSFLELPKRGVFGICGAIAILSILLVRSVPPWDSENMGLGLFRIMAPFAGL